MKFLFFLLTFITFNVFSQKNSNYIEIQGHRIYNYNNIDNGKISFSFHHKEKNKSKSKVKYQVLYFDKINKRDFKFRYYDLYETMDESNFINFYLQNKESFFAFNSIRNYIKRFDPDGINGMLFRKLPVFKFRDFIKKRKIKVTQLDSIVKFSTSEYDLFVSSNTGKINKIRYTNMEGVEYQEFIVIEEDYNSPNYTIDSFYSTEAMWKQFPEYEPYSEKKHEQKALLHTSNLPFPLYTSDGLSIDQDYLSGKHVLFYFWYRSCYPCMLGIPNVQKFKDKHGDAIHVIGVNVFDNMDQINAFCAKRNISFPTIMASEDFKSILYNELYVSSFPIYWLFDKNGELVSFQNGHRNDIYQSAEKSLDAKLNKQGQ